MKEYLFDGAFGSYFHSLTESSLSAEEAVLKLPECVYEIHARYVAAGATAIKTDTFRVDPALYSADEMQKITAAAWELANRAADGKATVFADIGRAQATDENEIESVYLDAARRFISLGAKHYLFETLDELEPILPAVNEIRRQMPDAEIFVSFACYPDGCTSAGYTAASLFAAAEGKGIDCVGLNCVSGPSNTLNTLKKMPRPALPFFAMPNAGYPQLIDGRRVYIDNPDYFASRLCEIKALGAAAIGGCCGTTPEHIKRTAALLSGKTDAKAFFETIPETVASRRGEFSFPKGRKLIAAELSPPSDTDFAFVSRGAADYISAGADLITVTDSPLSQARADSFITACKLMSDSGASVMPHLTCRDKNRTAIKASLLGGACAGLNAVLVVTGDASAECVCGSDSDKSVFCFNSHKLISYIKSLNDTVFSASPYLIAAALNVNAPNFTAELERAAVKEENGASLFLTQPIFGDRAVENLKTAKKRLKSRILAGLMPLSGYKNAVFMKNEVSGTDIPESLVETLRGKDRETAKPVVLDFCRSIASRCADFCDGYYIATPLKRTDLVSELISSIVKGEI